MPIHTPEIHIEGKSVEFLDGTLHSRGFNTASELKFTIPGQGISFRKFWNKEVTVFINSRDSSPIFRGRIIDNKIVDNIGMAFTAVDGFGFLTGHQKATVTLDTLKNVDGLSPGGTITKLISLANLSDVIGTDYIGDTDPVVQVKPLRGSIVILNVIKTILKEVANTSSDLTRENYMRVFDDGTKTQLKFEVMADLDNTIPVKTYSYDNLISFKINNRKIPTTITVEGNKCRATYRHSSAAEAYGENFLNVENQLLESRAECMDFARKVFDENLKNQYEYQISSDDGVYLNEGDVIEIISDDTDISGNFRVIGKKIDFSAGKFKLTLTVNKSPPILAQFLVS
tara:strand:- start:1558 stop:2583 length:1026 start_codon:yes stop_codon:yes gene_type:complete